MSALSTYFRKLTPRLRLTNSPGIKFHIAKPAACFATKTDGGLKPIKRVIVTNCTEYSTRLFIRTSGQRYIELQRPPGVSRFFQRPRAGTIKAVAYGAVK